VGLLCSKEVILAGFEDLPKRDPDPKVKNNNAELETKVSFRIT
jgi:hypothetical protein